MDKNHVKEFIIKEIINNKKIKEMFKNLMEHKIGVIRSFLNEHESKYNNFIDYYISGKDGDENAMEIYENIIVYEIKEKLKKSLSEKLDAKEEEEFHLFYLQVKDAIPGEKVSDTELKTAYSNIHHDLIANNYIVPEKYQKEIKKCLRDDEEIDFSLSRKVEGYIVIYTTINPCGTKTPDRASITHWKIKGFRKPILSFRKARINNNSRLLFFRKTDGEIKYLYDSTLLIKDWDKEQKKFRTLNESDPPIYLHLAISFHHKDKEFFVFQTRQAIWEFIKNNPKAKGKNAPKTIREMMWIFNVDFTVFYLIREAYFRLEMPEEIGFTYINYADDFLGGDNRLKGKGNIFLGNFTEARTLLKKAFEEERELSVNNPSIDRVQLLEDINAHYLWAFGMESWQAERKEEASIFLRDAAYQFHKKKAEHYARLMEYLCELVQKNRKLLSLRSQLYFLDKQSIEHAKKDTLEKSEFVLENRLGVKEKILIDSNEMEKLLERIEYLSDKFDSYENLIRSIELEKSEKLKGGKKSLKIPKEIEVNFSKDENYIKIDGRDTEVTGERIFSLLEELINRKILHWSFGLVIFVEWQKSIPDDPVKQFGMAVRRFNDEFGFTLIDYLPREKKKGKKEKRTRWALIKDIIIKSTIHESNSLCKETKKQKDPQNRLELLDKTLSLYPNSLGAITLLVNLLQNNPVLINQEKELIGKILPSAYDALVKRRDKLKGAIERIKEKIRNAEKCPYYWKEAKSYSYEMHNELKEIEPILNIIDKFLEDKKVTTSEDELNKISEEWELLEKLPKGEQGSDEEKYYKELLEQHFGRPIIKEILSKVSSKVQHRIADMGLSDEPRDITQEVFAYYLTLIRKGYYTKRNFKNMEELKGTLIKGLSLKATDEIIKIKYQGNLTETNLRMIRELLRAERELTQELYREPNDNEILKKLGPQWNREKIEEIYELKDELFKDERHIDIEEAQEFIEEVKRYEKEHREGIEQFFES